MFRSGKFLTAEDQREFDEVILKEDKFHKILEKEKIDPKHDYSSKAAIYYY